MERKYSEGDAGGEGAEGHREEHVPQLEPRKSETLKEKSISFK